MIVRIDQGGTKPRAKVLTGKQHVDAIIVHAIHQIGENKFKDLIKPDRKATLELAVWDKNGIIRIETITPEMLEGI